MSATLGETRRVTLVSLQRTLLVVAVLGLASVTTPAQTSPDEDGLSGAWEGQLLLRSNWRFMEAQFGGMGGQTEAKVDTPQARHEFRDFEVQAERLRWTLARASTRMRFDGTRMGDVIRGRVEQDGVAGEFQLVRVDRTAPAGAPGLTGTYRTSGRDFVTIARFDFGDGRDRLALMDTRDGYWGMLLPIAADRYVFAPARSGRFPADLRVEFRRDAAGSGSQLIMTGARRERRVASRVESYDTEEVAFRNGDVTLVGEVLRPRSGGPHPAVVMVHSSGHQSRNGPVGYFRLIANLLAANGIAALVFDKRGVGESTGHWTTATFDDLAGDALAAVATMRQAPRVDPERVGLWSLSQGGWIAPLAAARDARIAFLSLVSAAATTPAQQEIERVAMVMKASGATEDSIAGAGRYLRTFFEVVARRQLWEVLQSAMTDSAAESWIPYVPRPRTENELGWSPAFAAFDPAPILMKLTIPILAVHGSDDVDVRAASNSLMFAKISVHPGSRQNTIDRADHYMLVGVDDSDREYRRLSERYLGMTIDWIKQASGPRR